MWVLWYLPFVVLSVTAFNPMELYVDKKEGFSLAYEDDGTKYSYYHYYDYYYGYYAYGITYKQLDIQYYTRMQVGPSKGGNVYPVESFFYYNDGQGIIYHMTQYVQVYDNSDGTVSLKCVDNGLFATWGNMVSDSTGQNYARCEGVGHGCVLPICMESGICPHCRFSLVVGSISDIQIRLVHLTWGDPEDYLPSNPDQVDEANEYNYSDTTTTTTLKVTYKKSRKDTTIWEHAWGFELSVSVEADVHIPFVVGGSVTTTATASYNGKYGTENSVEDSQSTELTKKVDCPPMTQCTLKLVASKLDNFDMPFTALVEKTQDDGPPIQWTETGIWRGIQAFNFDSFYCTTNLETNETNCPSFKWME